MNISHTKAIIVSGILWFSIGLMLLAKGLNFIILSGQTAGREEVSLWIVALSLGIGFVKSKFILSKTVKRVIVTILARPNPFSIFELYSRSYYLIILSMVFLGVGMRWAPLPLEVRGAVDVAVGSALINGAVLYFRGALANKPL